jgi:hypothetical protein
MKMLLAAVVLVLSIATSANGEDLDACQRQVAELKTSVTATISQAQAAMARSGVKFDYLTKEGRQRLLAETGAAKRELEADKHLVDRLGDCGLDEVKRYEMTDQLDAMIKMLDVAKELPPPMAQ